MTVDTGGTSPSNLETAINKFNSPWNTKETNYMIEAIQAQFNLLNHRITKLEATLIQIQTKLEKI